MPEDRRFPYMRRLHLRDRPHCAWISSFPRCRSVGDRRSAEVVHAQGQVIAQNAWTEPSQGGDTVPPLLMSWAHRVPLPLLKEAARFSHENGLHGFHLLSL